MQQLTILQIGLAILLFAELNCLRAAELSTTSADNVILSNGKALTYLNGSCTQDHVHSDFQLLVTSEGNCYSTTCTFQTPDNSIYIVNSRPATKRIQVLGYWQGSDSRFTCDLQMNNDLAKQLANADFAVDPDSIHCTALHDTTATFHWRDSNWKVGSGSAEFRLDRNIGWILLPHTIQHEESGVTDR